MAPRVYIVLLNWNNAPDTVECLKSLKSLSYPNFQVLVADNGSTDGSAEVIVCEFPGVTLLRNGKNLGFAGGNNPGIKYAMANGADYVLLLNNDTVIEPDFLGRMVQLAESDLSIGIVSPKIFYFSEPKRIWFAGGMIDFHKGLTSHLGDQEIDRGQFDDILDVDFVSGCAMLIKKAVIQDAGLLYDKLFLYYEDSDYCARVHRTGYRIVMAQDARIWHKVSSTTSKIKDLQWFYGTRNMLIFEKRNARLVQLVYFVPYYLAKFVIYNALVAAFSGNLKKSLLIIKAGAEGFFT
jgi:GT2 family glycosyltransferase